MVGLAFGFAFRAVQTAMLLASQLMEQQLGMPFLSEVSDDEAGSPLGRLYQLIAGAIFFTLGGHRLVIGSLVDLSADAVASGWDTWAVLDGLVTILGQACWMGVRTAAPIALVLMTTSLAVGMLSRVLPQFAGPAVAQPVQVALGLLLILLSIAIAGPTLADGLTRVAHVFPAKLAGGAG